MTRSSVVTPIPTVTGPSNVSGPNESAANGSFNPPPLGGAPGARDCGRYRAVSRQPVPLAVPVPTATPRATRKPRAPTGTGMWRGGPPRPLSGRVAGSSQAPRRLLPEDAEPRWLLLYSGWVVGGPGSMCPESVPCGSAGKEYAGITGTLFSTRHSYLGSGRIRFTTRGRSAWP